MMRRCEEMRAIAGRSEITYTDESGKSRFSEEAPGFPLSGSPPGERSAGSLVVVVVFPFSKPGLARSIYNKK